MLLLLVEINKSGKHKVALVKLDSSRILLFVTPIKLGNLAIVGETKVPKLDLNHPVWCILC